MRGFSFCFLVWCCLIVGFYDTVQEMAYSTVGHTFSGSGFIHSTVGELQWPKGFPDRALYS